VTARAPVRKKPNVVVPWTDESGEFDPPARDEDELIGRRWLRDSRGDERLAPVSLKAGNCPHCGGWFNYVATVHEPTCPERLPRQIKGGIYAVGIEGPPLEEGWGPRWMCGKLKLSGAMRWVHIIRGPHDPERSARVKAGAPGSDTMSLWLKAMKKDDPGVWEPRILGLLSDGRPRTFNEIGVTLTDKSADVLYATPVDKALWSLVTDCAIEHTNEAPLYFRVKGSTQDPLDPGQVDREQGRSPKIEAMQAKERAKERARIDADKTAAGVKVPTPPADIARSMIAAFGHQEAESKAIDLALSQKTIWWLEVVAAIKTAGAPLPGP